MLKQITHLMFSLVLVFGFIGCGDSSNNKDDTTSPTITLSCDDSPSNEDDTTPPVITLKGNPTVTIEQGKKYTDAGATAKDDVDGVVEVIVSGSVDTSKVGTYTITYTATDEAGNEATKTRKVKVILSVTLDWQYPYKNILHTGEDENSYGSSSNTATKSWKNSENFKDIKLGDVTGDGKIDIIGLTDSGLKIFDENGNQQGLTISTHDGANYLILEDVDGDNVFEMIVGSKKESTTLSVKIYKYDGSVYKTFTRNGRYDFFLMKPIAYLGNNRLVIEYDSGYSMEPRGYSMWDISTSTELWYYDVGPDTAWNVSIADINNDGLKELVGDVFSGHNGATGSGYSGNGTITTDGDLYTIVINENGEEIFTKILGADFLGNNIYGDSSGSNGRGHHTFADMNGDGDIEIIAFVGHDTTYYQGTSHIKILDNSGTELYSTAVGYNAFYGRSYIIADLDNDGKKEIIVDANELNKFLIYDHELNLITSLENTNYYPILASDIDGDGKKEIIVKDGKKLHALSLDSSIINKKWSLNFSSNVLDCLVSNIDSDDKAELIVKTNDSLYRFDM